MTTLAPLPIQSFKDNNGNPLAGGLLYTYAAGTSTPQATYQDVTTTSPNANPIVLNSRGEAQIWLNPSQTYKLVLYDSFSTLIWSVDQVSNAAGITSSSIQTQTYTAVTTTGTSTAYVIATNPTQVTLVAGQRYRIGLHTPNGIAPTLVRDGLAAVTFKIYNSLGAKVSPAAATLPALFDVEYDGADYVVFTSLPNLFVDMSLLATSGTATAYTITPSPAITAYVIGQSYLVNFVLSSGASPTLQISGIATPPNLVKENADGTYSVLIAGDIPAAHRSRVTLISTTQALIERMPPAFSMVRVLGANGYGSTNTKVRRFTTIATNQGGSITYADSATLGGTFTVGAAGVYSATFTDQFTGACSIALISNGTNGAASITALTANEILASTTVSSPSYGISVAWTGYLAAGAVIWAQTDGIATGASTAINSFTISKVS